MANGEIQYELEKSYFFHAFSISNTPFKVFMFKKDPANFRDIRASFREF